MQVVICPGMHRPQLTENFLAGLRSTRTGNNSSLSCLAPPIICHSLQSPPYCCGQMLQFLCSEIGWHRIPTAPLVLISFSAGVVGAIGAAWGWQLLGGKVRAFFAIDGWGVPLAGNFPIHRLSSDYFTHWSSALLGGADAAASFYADPPQPHLQIWQAPQLCHGWQVDPSGQVAQMPTTAADFLIKLLQKYSN